MLAHPDVKIVSIEETAELRIPHKNWIPSVVRAGYELTGGKVGEVTMFDLLKAALRQRPDFIVVGEIRGEEAYTLFQAMSSGHMGLSTLHADSISDVIHRLESPPINVSRVLIKQLNLILFQARVRVKGRSVRRVKEIREMVGLDPTTQALITNPVYVWDAGTDTFKFTGRSYFLEKISKEKAIPLEDIYKEINNRKRVIEWMVRNEIREYDRVVQVIREYYISKERVLARVERDEAMREKVGRPLIRRKEH